MAEDRAEQEEESRGESGQSQMLLEQRSWRYAYEALTRVHSMRLFLFNPVLSFPLRCQSLRAYLQPTSPFSASPVVVCRWNSPEGDSHTIYVPMPFCLIDHSAPFVVQCRTDFIEVKLKLLPFGGSFLDGLTFLGFSHRGVPIMRDGSRKTEAQRRDEAPFSLASDAELLASKSDVSFFCRRCSAKLNHGRLSRVLELPSMEWRELADHWFGTCCCSDGAKTESLVAQFQQLMTPARGLCLVGSTTCVIHPDDLVIGGEDRRSGLARESYPDVCGAGNEEVSKSAGTLPEVIDEPGNPVTVRSGQRLVVGGETAALATEASEADTCGSGVIFQENEDDVSVERKNAANPEACLNNRDDVVLGAEDHSMGEVVEQSPDCATHCGGGHVAGKGVSGVSNLAASHSMGEVVEQSHDCATHCGGGHVAGKGGSGISNLAASHSMGEVVEQSHDCATHCGGHAAATGGSGVSNLADSTKPIANGFMSGPSAASSSPTWTPVHCHSCSALLGVTSEKEEGIQLFKCYVSTDASTGGPEDIFRYHTLERVFCNELLASTEENSSYRYIIHGANTKVPLLQLVLLNHESWNCAGSCLGEVSSLPDEGNDPLDDDDDDNFMVSSPERDLLVGLGKEEFPPAFLEPVMKVMFSDISNFSVEDLSRVEEWAEKHQADDIYMLESEVLLLTKTLHANQRLFPDSCATFEQFRSSFLAR